MENTFANLFNYSKIWVLIIIIIIKDYANLLISQQFHYFNVAFFCMMIISGQLYQPGIFNFILKKILKLILIKNVKTSNCLCNWIFYLFIFWEKKKKYIIGPHSNCLFRLLLIPAQIPSHIVLLLLFHCYFKIPRHIRAVVCSLHNWCSNDVLSCLLENVVKLMNVAPVVFLLCAALLTILTLLSWCFIIGMATAWGFQCIKKRWREKQAWWNIVAHCQLSELE